jgi:hypothetical protein
MLWAHTERYEDFSLRLFGVLRVLVLNPTSKCYRICRKVKLDAINVEFWYIFRSTHPWFIIMTNYVTT